jgi:23S rRNA pseudouridine2457 synthase
MSFQYIMFNKPYGVLSQFTDEGTGHPTLKEYIDVPNIYAAGRLDRDSEGLLVLTNDGKLIKRLTDPSHHAIKTYWVLIEGDPTPERLIRIREGVVIHGYKTVSCDAHLISEPNLAPRSKPVTPHGPTSWLEMKLRQGKKRQVRHMTAAVGLFTLRILRVAIDCLQLGDLEVGTWRDLTPIEIQSLKAIQ